MTNAPPSSHTVPSPILLASPKAIARAAAHLKGGGVVAFPTETVYGLGADATSDAAVAAIYAAKDRPRFNPLIIHTAASTAAERLARFDNRAEHLADAFWPGPMTLVLPRRSDAPISLLAMAGLDTVAVRVPAHPIARTLLQAVARPIAAPSANRSGEVSPTTAGHVRESLGDRVDMILAGGRSTVGLESTVIDLTGEAAAVLRPGAVTAEMIETVIGGAVLRPSAEAETPTDGRHLAPSSPGQLASHYAPTAMVRLAAKSAQPGEALLTFGPDMRAGPMVLNLSETGDLTEAAANLFAHLRTLDALAPRAIAVVPIPEQGLGVAINDRLRRAAAPR